MIFSYQTKGIGRRSTMKLTISIINIAILLFGSTQAWLFGGGSNDRSFNEDGPGELQTSITNPFDALRARELADQSLRDAQRLYSGRGLSDGEGDAFRHTLWNYRMTQDIGRSEAKKFGDAHERGNILRGGYGTNNPGSRDMDLHNNHVGRNLQTEDGMSDIEIVQRAMQNGLTQNSPRRKRRSLRARRNA